MIIKVEAFKNLVKNYTYYQDRMIELSEVLKTQNLLKKEDTLYERVCCLKKYNFKELEQLNLNVLETFHQLTGDTAIRYDVEPSAYNENLAENIRLSLIDKYNLQITELIASMDKTEKKLKNELSMMGTINKYIEEVIVQLPKDIKDVLIDILCNGKTYANSSDKVAYTDGGLFKRIEKELDKIL